MSTPMIAISGNFNNFCNSVERYLFSTVSQICTFMTSYYDYDGLMITLSMHIGLALMLLFQV